MEFIKNLFNLNKVKEWEKEVLINVFTLLGDEYINYSNQIKENLLSNYLLSSDAFPNLVRFTYSQEVAEIYRQKIGEIFTLKGIKVFDFISNNYIDFFINISHGLVTGYFTPNNKKFKLDINKITISNLQKEYWGDADYKEIEDILDESERDLINRYDVHEVILNDKTYYNIREIGDGDFIGIDTNKNIYKITHDPYEIVRIEKSLLEVLNNTYFL
jgi:hypothetical protein